MIHLSARFRSAAADAFRRDEGEKRNAEVDVCIFSSQNSGWLQHKHVAIIRHNTTGA